MKKYFNHHVKKALVVQSLITIEALEVSSTFSYPDEAHDFYEFAYIDSGKILCRKECENVELIKGDFLLIPPQKRHFYAAIEGYSASIFIVCFRSTAEILKIFEKKIALSSEMKKLLFDIITESKKAFCFPFEKKLKLLSKPDFGAQQLVENNIERLFIHLIRQEISTNENISFVMNSTELENNLVKDILNLLKESLYTRITLDDICKQTFYSKTFINNAFKKNTGSSIMRYYTGLKIDEAKKLLRENVAPSAVSARLCFESPTYFTKVFKKHTGKTPSEYSKSML
ncbi:MAG: helix-turn-helix domain-containing protein [Clostridia bacterium]|nr:helix-turn-helix domain-containing protein [Clostridia bacterium]